MRLIAKNLTFFLLVVMLAIVIAACNPSEYEETTPQIISAASLTDLISNNDNLVIVDMQSPEEYAAEHVNGAVNIIKDDIVINVPVENMLTSKSKFERLMGEKGIDNDSTIIIYDNDKMSAARLWWSLLVYGNENARVIDGGLEAIKRAGIELTGEVPEIQKTTYTADEKNKAFLSDISDVMDQINEPNPNVVLLDVRTDEEFSESGKVPSSVMYDYNNIFYSDNTFKDVQATRINFIDNGMRPEKEIILYCRTSMRASAVFLSLYNAGYRNIKIYDGAYLEWSSNPNNPIELPAGASALPSKKDAS
ncbi:sulfurtransferase [Sinanaerobacter chloroacetimidivorans]|uniref:thiosulfate sulfurtransferase n=1 Tax=Sinanaerobacter chloroacetimidivorans TaxID=2818044 RepID=A0A8J7VY19_9FIRM|nr:rhodanese-like domain-containing protein [Sinanaerobacter chloroacetimidivorans]MBR0597177.1 sulfurtransferase [Sinanaerobacter chloroacetimidivorans]